MSEFHFVMPTGTTALVGSPIADFMADGTITDTVCMSKYKTAYFFIFWADTTGGTAASTFTVIPIDSVGGTTTTAIPFQWMRVSSTETNTDWAWATSNTMSATAGKNQMYVIKVRSDDLPLVTGVKYEYCYVNVAETVNDPALGGGFIMMADPRYDEATLDAVTT